MSDYILVGYDGSDASHRAVDFAADRARTLQGRLLVAHIIEWSPYSLLTVEELEQRHKRRKEEVTRAENELLKPLLDQLTAAGIQVKAEVRYGHTVAIMTELVDEYGVKEIVVGRRGRSTMQAMLFGSISASLVQVATVPVTVVP